jgi:hypothetical protein
MPRYGDFENDWDDELDPDEEDDHPTEEDQDEPTIPCPYCRRDVHEDSQRCPYCENYISQEDAPPSRKPWWLLIGVAACLFAVYLWIRWH